MMVSILGEILNEREELSQLKMGMILTKYVVEMKELIWEMKWCLDLNKGKNSPESQEVSYGQY